MAIEPTASITGGMNDSEYGYAVGEILEEDEIWEPAGHCGSNLVVDATERLGEFRDRVKLLPNGVTKSVSELDGYPIVVADSRFKILSGERVISSWLSHRLVATTLRHLLRLKDSL